MIQKSVVLTQPDVSRLVPHSSVAWDAYRCVHCGACVGQCAPGAFRVDPPTRRISFHAVACIACELCIAACPFGALQSVTGPAGRKGAP